MQVDGNGLFANRPTTLEYGYVQTLRSRLQIKPEWRGAGLTIIGGQAQHDQQRVALAGSQTQSAQRLYPSPWHPAQQRRASIVSQSLLAGPKAVVGIVGLNPEQTPGA